MNTPSSKSQYRRATPRLPVQDAQRTIAFYQDLLGFTPAGGWPENAPTFLLLECAGVALAFDVVPDKTTPAVRDSTGFYLETVNVLQAYEALKDRVKIEWGPEVYAYGCREFAVRDPDGYLIIFTEETDAAPTCDGL